nr:MAG TPA: GrpB protein [Caudoviricetes sp.]
MGLINNTVSLENNYELYKKIFKEEKAYLESVFKENRFKIEHVGSTAVKNLLSKPVVDIAIGVDDLNSFKKYYSLLNKRYTITENREKEEILLVKENEKETFCLIHVLDIKSNRYTNMIKFRDILINNLDILKKYENLKIDLAKKYKNDRKNYTKSKNEFINEVLKNKKEID